MFRKYQILTLGYKGPCGLGHDPLWPQESLTRCSPDTGGSSSTNPSTRKRPTGRHGLLQTERGMPGSPVTVINYFCIMSYKFVIVTMFFLVHYICFRFTLRNIAFRDLCRECQCAEACRTHALTWCGRGIYDCLE